MTAIALQAEKKRVARLIAVGSALFTVAIVGVASVLAVAA
jgi:hypothetical protein